MWEVDEYEVISLGRTPGGNRFTEFVDSIIFAESYLSGLDSSSIRTNLRTNLPDGGVDTEVCQPLLKDSTDFGAFSITYNLAIQSQRLFSKKRRQ